jgi:PE family
VVAAALPTTTVLPAAADEVSQGIVAIFGGTARQYQAVAAQAATLHQQFVQTLQASAGAYGSADAANVSLAQLLSPLESL